MASPVPLPTGSTLGVFGILLQGMPESLIENLEIRDIRVRVADAMAYDNRTKHQGGRLLMNDQRVSQFARLPSW